MRLAEILKEKGMPQVELAKLTGISEQTISRYVNEERMPKLDAAAKIAKVLNISIDELVYDKVEHNDYDTADILLDACSKKVRELSQVYRISISDSTKKFLISKEIELYQTIIPSFIVSTLNNHMED